MHFPDLSVEYSFEMTNYCLNYITRIIQKGGNFNSIKHMAKSFIKKILIYLAGLIVVNFVVLTRNDFLFLGTLFTFTYIILAPGLLVLPFFSEKKLPYALGLALGGSLSALLFMLLGLVSNMLLPFLGNGRPLETLPLLAALDIFMLIMLILTYAAKKDFVLEKPELHLSDKLIIFFAFLLPVLAAAGAVVLTNGGTNMIAMAVIALIAVLAMLAVGGKAKLETSSFAVLLYGITVAILLMTSMRGYFLTGHDVQLEYQIFSLTNRLKLWDINNFEDAYNACLSITILPTYLQSILHVQDFYIYKFFFQFINGLLAVVIFYLARHFSTDKTAFLSALLYVTFPTFIVDMAMLNRQGMALLFFGALFFVLLTDEFFAGKKRSLLLVLFGTGMILSHYSTSYIAVAMLAGGYVLNILMRFFFSMKRVQKISLLDIAAGNAERSRRPNLLQLPVAIILICVLAIWTGPVTKTSQNLTQTAGKIVTSLENPFQKDENDTGPQKYGLNNAKQLSKDELFKLFMQEAVATSRKDSSEEDFYSKETTQKYKESPIDEPMLALTPAGKKIQETLDAPLKGLYNETKQFYAKIMQIFIFLGLLGLLLGRKFNGHLKRDVPMEFIALGGAGVFVMAMQMILPQSVIDYGLLRLFQQNLVLLALPVTMGFLAAFGMIARKRKTHFVLFGGFLMAFFLILSGFIPQLTGGSRPMLTLNNSGFYYDAYFIHGGEMDAFLWLKGQGIDLPVQSDMYFSNVRLLTYSDIGARPRILPETTLKDSIVYQSYTNSVKGSAIEFIDGDVLYYTLPTKFFDDNKNLIYSSGQSKVYK